MLAILVVLGEKTRQ